MPDFISLVTDPTLPQAIILFGVASIIILLIGLRLSRYADILADRTGLGEAIAGAVLLGAATSASGIVTSISSAATGDINLAYSNSLGGIAAQTAFLAIADICYRRANLEHAAAEIVNVTQAGMLCLLLTVPLIAYALPQISFFGIHPASFILIGLYVVGLRIAHQDRKSPMWLPKNTPETREDEPEDESDDAPSTLVLFALFAAMVIVISIAGLLVARAGITIAASAGIKQSVVGAAMTAVATSLPELVTTIAAVRRNALQLAVGGIIGGNTFDVLFLAASDVAYSDGSIYGAIDNGARLWALIGIVMTLILLLGLIRREQNGPGKIGIESVSVLGIYALSLIAVSTIA